VIGTYDNVVTNRQTRIPTVIIRIIFRQQLDPDWRVAALWIESFRTIART